MRTLIHTVKVHTQVVLIQCHHQFKFTIFWTLCPAFDLALFLDGIWIKSRTSHLTLAKCLVYHGAINIVFAFYSVFKVNKFHFKNFLLQLKDYRMLLRIRKKKKQDGVEIRMKATVASVQNVNSRPKVSARARNPTN